MVNTHTLESEAGAHSGAHPRQSLLLIKRRDSWYDLKEGISLGRMSPSEIHKVTPKFILPGNMGGYFHSGYPFTPWEDANPHWSIPMEGHLKYKEWWIWKDSIFTLVFFPNDSCYVDNIMNLLRDLRTLHSMACFNDNEHRYLLGWTKWNRHFCTAIGNLVWFKLICGVSEWGEKAIPEE